MADNHDERALKVLEKAVYKAQASLEEIKHFQPFIMLLNDAGEIEIFENEIEDSIKSYAALEETLKVHIQSNNIDIDILVLVVDTLIPDKFVKDVSSGIRLHLEEKSQINNKIGARYLYVPYELCKAADSDMFVKLHTPIPVGFPAEYIVK